MSLPFRVILSDVALLLFSIPALARAGRGRTDTSNWIADQETKIGSVDLKPGNYEFRSQESGNKLQILQNGEMIGEVSCRWIALPQKPADSQVLTDNDQITQLEFAGRTEAVQIQ